MSDTKNSAVPHTTLHDLSGLGLIILGALFLTSAVLYVKGGPVENAGQYTLFMTGCIETFGASAIIWICLGLVFVGGRLFLFGGERGLIRDAAGFCATGLGLSILLGGFSPVHGGGFGRLTVGTNDDRARRARVVLEQAIARVAVEMQMAVAGMISESPGDAPEPLTMWETVARAAPSSWISSSVRCAPWIAVNRLSISPCSAAIASIAYSPLT